MTEEDARRVTLLQALEAAPIAPAAWGDADRAWATRTALQDPPSSAEAFIARRAQHAMQRLEPRDPALVRLLVRRARATTWLGAALLVGLLIGALADSIGSSQRINLLAPPMWAVLGWNVVVYALLLAGLLASLLRRPTRPGALRQLTARLLRRGSDGALPGAVATAGGKGSARQRFAALWWARSARLSTARAGVVLHAAAAAVALGLIGGLYLRGLVLDYRAAWESTFVDAGTAHAIVATLLAPAVAIAGIAIPGISIPDVAAFEGLRSVPGQAAAAPAAAWIHLFALTLFGAVVLPRALLATVTAARARWLSARFTLPLAEPYFQGLVRQWSGGAARVVVQPYASTPGAQAALGLQAVLAAALGDGPKISIAPTAGFGAEDETGAALAADTTLAIALFDLSATPEAETHGRYARQLAARAPAGAATVVMVDEAAFRRRFGAADPARVDQRREAWRQFAQALDTPLVGLDLDGADAAAASPALRDAMRSPVVRAAG